MEVEKLLKRKKRAQTEQNVELLVTTVKKLAELYHSKGQYEEALKAYEEEKELLSNMGKPMEIARANRFMGEIYCSSGDYKAALQKFKEYFDIATAEKDLIEEQRALASIGRTYFCKAESYSKSDQTEFNRALREAKQAYILSLKVCDKITNINRHELLQMRARLLLNIGLVFEYQGDFEKAVEHIQMAIAINVKADLYDDTQLCYTSIAGLYQKQQNSTFALKYYDLALEIQERLPNKMQLMCETLSNKADVYFSVANYKAAKQSLVKAYRLCRGTSEDETFIERNLRLAHILCKCGNELISLTDCDQNEMKQLYETMGDACCSVKNFNQAIGFYKKMLECCETLGYCGKDLLPAIISLSQTYKDAGMYEESLQFLRKEVEIWDDNYEEACKTSLNIVRVLKLKKAGYSELMKDLKKSHDFAVIANNEELEIKVLGRMLKIQEENGFAEDANETRNKIEAINPDVSLLESLCDSTDEEEEVETPEVIYSIPISEILEDEPEPNTIEASRPRQLRRQQQNVKKGLKIHRNEKGETPLHIACIQGCPNKVQQLISREHPVNVTDNAGWTPLHEVCNHGHVQLVNILLDNGANINDPGGDGSEGVTPLHDACSNGHLEIVQILLDRGASTDVKTNDNKTPLDFLLDWATRTGALSEDQIGLFETIKDKFQRDLEKVGVSTETVNIPTVEHIAQKTNISERNRLKQKDKSSKIRVETGKRHWSDSSSESLYGDFNGDSEKTKHHSDIDESDDDKAMSDYDDNDQINGSLIFSPALTEEDPALEYQKVMKGLRKRVQKYPVKMSKTAKSGALIGDSDVVDDWLIDDMKDQMRPNKKRKTQNADMGGTKLIGTLRKDDVIEGDLGKYFETDFIELEELPSEHEEVSQHHKQSRDKKCPYQSSLLDSGITCISEKSPPQNNALSHNVESEACIPSVKIHIEDTTLLVPVLCHDPGQPVTIDWLTKEAASRFLKLDGREPILVLVTSDGAKLAAEDPVAVINGRELIGQITGWKTMSLRQQYEAVCSASGTGCDELIKNRLQECDTTHCLNLRDCIFNLGSLNPIIKSLCHEHSLRELLLGSNALMDDGIEILSSIKGLPFLEVCDLKCNNITSIGLHSLGNFLINCQSLKILDLSFNDFEYGWLKSIHRISKYLNHLISLNLKACDISGDEFLTWEENEPALNNLKYLETLDISDNPLGEHGINGFLYHLKTNTVRKLCVSKTALDNSKGTSKIVQFFQREDPSNLRFLDLSDCDITDNELMDIIRCLNPAQHLTTLLLCNNSKLSTSSLKALMRMQNVPQELDLTGCDSLYPAVDQSNDLTVDNEFLKKLSTLTMDVHPKLASTKHWSGKFEECWKEIWGNRAKVVKGPSGLLKFILASRSDERDNQEKINLEKRSL